MTLFSPRCFDVGGLEESARRQARPPRRACIACHSRASGAYDHPQPGHGGLRRDMSADPCAPTPVDLSPFLFGQHRLGGNRRPVRNMVFAAVSSFCDGKIRALGLARILHTRLCDASASGSATQLAPRPSGFVTKRALRRHSAYSPSAEESKMTPPPTL